MRCKMLLFLVVLCLLVVSSTLVFARHQKGTKFKGTMVDSSGRKCTSAVLTLNTDSGPSGRSGSAKGCGWSYGFMEYGHGNVRYCNVTETADSISFKCNYRGKGVSMIGSFTGKVIK